MEFMGVMWLLPLPNPSTPSALRKSSMLAGLSLLSCALSLLPLRVWPIVLGGRAAALPYRRFMLLRAQGIAHAAGVTAARSAERAGAGVFGAASRQRDARGSGVVPWGRSLARRDACPAGGWLTVVRRDAAIVQS